MKPEDRIFNPSRETDRLLSQAEAIGPHTFSLCEKWFNEEGRSGQRRMYGLVNLVRHYPAGCIEKAAELAKGNGLRSSKALRRMVESMAVEAQEIKADQSDELTQNHPLIRSGEDYAAFWNQHAARADSAVIPVQIEIPCSRPPVVDIRRVWQQASWHKVIEIFGLSVDDKRRSRDDEIWLKSPFTLEERASMHVSLSANVYKDFSSGKGGGIMQFCREMLLIQGRQMSMFEVARWMEAEGISKALPALQPRAARGCEPQSPAYGRPSTLNSTNRAVEIDLRPYLRTDHPEWGRRGISAPTCRYLGCGFLPHRVGAKAPSPLNSRLVFQVRGVLEKDHYLQPIILSHSGRALTLEQEESDGKYWSYPFRKGLEIYNQDRLLLDMEACSQTATFGLILVEGFFDVAKLVEAGCRNVGALMGAHISAEQIERLEWMRSRIGFSRIVLFLDRDQAGREGARRTAEQLLRHSFDVSVFDWNRSVSGNGQGLGPIPSTTQDPGDMSVEQLQCLREQGLI